MFNECVQRASDSSIEMEKEDSCVVMDKEEQKWEQELEEDEKEEDSLKVRRSRARSEGTRIASDATTAAAQDASEFKNNVQTNGHVVHHSESVADNVVDESTIDESEGKEGPEKILAPTEITEGYSKSDNCVYYDKDEEHIEENHGDDGLSITTAKFGSKKHLNSGIEYQHEGIQKNVNLINPQHPEILPEECSTSYNSSKITEIETADLDLVDETDVERAELDVERVLQKQNTHDLYCPNCNSCITRRVILHKRKRQVRITSEDVKLKKPETVIDSTVKENYGEATSDKGQDTGGIHLDGTSEPAANDYEHDREQDIFRCLSCFSIFIPTGKGSKLFQIFGDKGKKNTMEDQQISSSLLSDKDRTTTGPGSDLKGDAQQTNSRVHMPSSNLNDLNQTAKARGDGDKALPSSEQQQLMHEKVMPNAGNIAYDANTMKKDMESILSLPEVDVKGNMTTAVEIFHEHEQHVGAMVSHISAYENGKKDKLSNNDGAFYELPQQTTNEDKAEIDAGEHLKINRDTLALSIKEPILIQDKQADTVKDLKKVTIEHGAGKDTVIVVEAGPDKTAASQMLQDLNASAESGTSPHLATDINVVAQMQSDAGESYEVEIIKSIVYGGLVESIMSLSVVSSAAGGDTATLNILALALANVIGGLVLLGHNLWELKKYHVVEAANQVTEQIDRYKELLGRRENFAVHATIAVLSFIIFGLISPITYGFSFRKSDYRDFKLLATAAISLVCIVLLATGKAYVRKPPKSYLKTVGYYVLLGFTVSGISYAAGELINRLLDKLHMLQSDSIVVEPFSQSRPDASLWASY